MFRFFNNNRSSRIDSTDGAIGGQIISSTNENESLESKLLAEQDFRNNEAVDILLENGLSLIKYRFIMAVLDYERNTEDKKVKKFKGKKIVETFLSKKSKFYLLSKDDDDALVMVKSLSNEELLMNLKIKFLQELAVYLLKE